MQYTLLLLLACSTVTYVSGRTLTNPPHAIPKILRNAADHPSLLLHPNGPMLNQTALTDGNTSSPHLRPPAARLNATQPTCDSRRFGNPNIESCLSALSKLPDGRIPFSVSVPSMGPTRVIPWYVLERSQKWNTGIRMHFNAWNEAGSHQPQDPYY